MEMSETQPHKNIRVLAWLNFFTDFQPYAPVLILYFVKVTGSYASALGLFSIATISRVVAEVPTGIFSDRIGRKNTIIIGAICAVLAFVLYATGNPWALVVGAILAGVSDAFYSGNNDALLHDSLSENNQQDDYAHNLGRLSSIFQLSLAISAILGSMIASRSFVILMWVSVLPQIACAIIATQLTEPENSKGRINQNILVDLKLALTEFWHSRNLKLLSGAALLENAVGDASYRFQASFFAAIVPIWVVGVIRAATNAIAFIGFRFAGKVTKRFGLLKSALSSSIIIRTLNLLAYGFPSLLSSFLIPLTSLPFGVSAVAKNSLFQKEYRPEVRATMGSVTSMIESILFTIIAFLMGTLADHSSPAMAIVIFQAILIPTAILYIMMKKKRKIELSYSS